MINLISSEHQSENAPESEATISERDVTEPDRKNHSRALNRAQKFYPLKVRQHLSMESKYWSNSEELELTKKMQCVILRSWHDLEGFATSTSRIADCFSNPWRNLFSKIGYLKTLSINIKSETPFSPAYWELNRRLLIARVERDDIALLDVISATLRLDNNHATKFFQMGQDLINALLCESMLHLFDLIEDRTTSEIRIGVTRNFLSELIINNYYPLLSSYNQSFDLTHNDDDQNFPVYSLPLARIIKLIDSRFDTTHSYDRDHYMQQIKLRTPNSTTSLSSTERIAITNALLSKYNEQSQNLTQAGVAANR